MSENDNILDRRLLAAELTRHYVRYDDTGRVTHMGTASIGSIEAQRLQGLPIAIGGPGLEAGMNASEIPVYVDLEAALIKPDSECALDHPPVLPKMECPVEVDGLDLYDLPVPCTIEIWDSTNLIKSKYQKNVPSTTLTFAHPGTYNVRITSAKFWAKELQVTAT